MYTRTELTKMRAETVAAMTNYADARGAIGEKEVHAIVNALNLGVDIGLGIAASKSAAAEPAEKKEG